MSHVSNWHHFPIEGWLENREGDPGAATIFISHLQMNYVNNGKIRLATEQSLVKAAKTQPMFGRNSYDVIVSMLVSFFEVNSSPCVVHLSDAPFTCLPSFAHAI